MIDLVRSILSDPDIDEHEGRREGEHTPEHSF
jgi:hypothetical protein